MSLLTATARDLMSSDVFRLEASASLDEAVESFEEYRISGAPVVDTRGVAIGVLSMSDIVRREHLAEGRIESDRGHSYYANPLADWDDNEFGDKSDYSPEILGRQTVSEWMTPRVVSVSPDTSICELCRVMHEQSVHRVLVTGDDGRILGIVTTTDLVRYLGQR